RGGIVPGVHIPGGDGQTVAPESQHLEGVEPPAGGPIERGRGAQQSAKQVLSPLDFAKRFPSGRLGERSVQERMVPDDVSLSGYTPDEVWVTDGQPTDHEKGRRNAQAPQHLQEARRIVRMRSIIKGQANRAAL